jgi:hypothetical protein
VISWLLTKRAGSGFVSQRYRSADLDSYQNITDPEHWFLSEFLQETLDLDIGDTWKRSKRGGGGI